MAPGARRWALRGSPHLPTEKHSLSSTMLQEKGGLQEGKDGWWLSVDLQAPLLLTYCWSLRYGWDFSPGPLVCTQAPKPLRGRMTIRGSAAGGPQQGWAKSEAETGQPACISPERGWKPALPLVPADVGLCPEPGKCSHSQDELQLP